VAVLLDRFYEPELAVLGFQAREGAVDVAVGVFQPAFVRTFFDFPRVFFTLGAGATFVFTGFGVFLGNVGVDAVEFFAEFDFYTFLFTVRVPFFIFFRRFDFFGFVRIRDDFFVFFFGVVFERNGLLRDDDGAVAQRAPEFEFGFFDFEARRFADFSREVRLELRRDREVSLLFFDDAAGSGSRDALTESDVNQNRARLVDLARFGEEFAGDLRRFQTRFRRVDFAFFFSPVR